MLTYFLNGREGFKKPLPDLSKAASLEEHTFKWTKGKKAKNLNQKEEDLKRQNKE